MIKNPYSGKLIAFEGIDSSGKTTQMQRAVNFLRACGLDPIVTKEPNKDFRSGRLIYGLLFGMHGPKFSGMTQLGRQRFYFINRMEHYQHVVIPALEAGRIVITDRSLASISLDVQKSGDLEMLLGDEEDIFKMGAVPFVRPDLVLVYDVPVEVSWERHRAKHREADFFESADLRSRTQQRNAYLEFTSKFRDWVRIIDGQGSEEEVFIRTREALRRELNLKEWR